MPGVPGVPFPRRVSNRLHPFPICLCPDSPSISPLLTFNFRLPPRWAGRHAEGASDSPLVNFRPSTACVSMQVPCTVTLQIPETAAWARQLGPTNTMSTSRSLTTPRSRSLVGFRYRNTILSFLSARSFEESETHPFFHFQPYVLLTFTAHTLTHLSSQPS